MSLDAREVLEQTLCDMVMMTVDADREEVMADIREIPDDALFDAIIEGIRG